MANKNLFASVAQSAAKTANKVAQNLGLIPAADAINEAGGKAYKMTPEHALAQLAVTGCFNHTFYASAQDQLQKVIDAAMKCDGEYVAQVAIFARNRGYMKDMPAILTAYLASYEQAYFIDTFNRVIDSPKVLRVFVQMLRSGVLGRKSLGSLAKRAVQKWFDARTDEQLFRGSVGNDPSLADVIKLAHPKPNTPARAALYAYLIGKPADLALLPPIVQEFEAYKQTMGRCQDVVDQFTSPTMPMLPKNANKTQRKEYNAAMSAYHVQLNQVNQMRKVAQMQALTAAQKIPVPDVPFEMLTALPLQPHQWVEIAKNASWQMTRMNLNTFARHKVFDHKNMASMITQRLANKEEIKKARAFPYQLLAAYTNADSIVPSMVKNALQQAMEYAIENVPEIDGKVYILPDVSGSMHSPVTGHRAGATTSVRCIDVAALIAAALMRKNPQAEVIPFEHRIVNIKLNPWDSVMTNAQALARIGGGGTTTSAPLAHLNQQKAKGDMVIFVSDNESWMDPQHNHGTATMQEWDVFKRRNPKARLVCIDIQPYVTTPVADREDILNVGGFSDQVFDAISAHAEKGKHDWVQTIKEISVYQSILVPDSPEALQAHKNIHKDAHPDTRKDTRKDAPKNKQSKSAGKSASK